MQLLIDAQQIAPNAWAAMAELQAYVNKSGLEHSLLERIKIRASQIKHRRPLNAWHETELYSARERAALAWTESPTLAADTHVPGDVYEEAHRYFPDKELVDLSCVVMAINGWNRLAIAFRFPPAVSKASAAA